MSAIKPYFVVNVSCVFPAEKDEAGNPKAVPVFIYEPERGKCSFSQVVVNEIASALEAGLLIIGDSYNPEIIKEAERNEQEITISTGFHQES